MRVGYLAPFLVEAAPWVAMMDAPQATVACDEQGQLVFANRAMLDLLDVDAAQLLGLGWARLLLADDSDEPQVRALVAAPGATTHRRTLGLGTRVVELTCSAIAFDGTGRRGHSVQGLLGVAVEVPAMAASATTTTRSHAQLVEDSPDIWMRFDHEQRMVYVSAGVERVTGLTPASLLADGSLFARVVHPDYLEPWREALSRSVAGDSRTFDVVVVHTNGNQVILQQTLYPVGGGLVEGAGRDITQIRQLEALKVKNEERAMLDRLKSQLLSNVSHELRTPLVSIKGYVDLLLRGALGSVNPRQRRGLEIAGANTDRLIELIETLLDFADRQEDRLLLHRRRFDLRDSISDALGSVAARMQSRGLLVDVALGHDALEVFGDRARLSQVMRALLGNAEKFSADPRRAEGGGHAPDISVRVERTAHTVSVSVRDRGIGIPKSVQRRIFDRFYQVDGSSTRQFGGAGLGLAMAKELVTLHGGEILVESAEGQGSLFTIRLPRAEAERGDHAPDRAVVLVAAEASLFAELRQTMATLPIDLVFSESERDSETQDGSPLWRRARRHRPDVVVLAVANPAEAVAELRRDPETAATPVVVVAPSSAEASMFMSARADLVVEREDWGKLREALQRLLGLETPRAQREVVVVEDEVEILDFMRFLLEKEGYDVVGLQSGKQALERVTRDTGLVILDIALDGGGDGLDGIEVCRALKQALDRPVPILITTAMSGEDVRKISMAAGADGYLVKPFGVDEFLRHVRAHLA